MRQIFSVLKVKNQKTHWSANSWGGARYTLFLGLYLWKLKKCSVFIEMRTTREVSEGSAKDRLSIFAVLLPRNEVRSSLKIAEFQTLKSFLFENAVRVRWLDMFIRLHNQHIIHPQREPRLRKSSSDLNNSILLFNNYLFFSFLVALKRAVLMVWFF